MVKLLEAGTWLSPGTAKFRTRAARSPRRRPEDALQRAVAAFLHHAARADVAWTHVPNGEARSRAAGGKLKGFGTQPGWPDIVLVRGGSFYGLELKAPGGRTSSAQKAAHERLYAAGAAVAVAWNLDEAIAQLRAWGLVRVS